MLANTFLFRHAMGLAVASGLMMVMLPVAVLAGGFEIGDQGARAAGRGGAFAARADDLSAVEYNPAGLARLRGTRFYLGNRFTYASEEFRRAATLDWSEAVHGMPRYVEFEAVRNSNPWQLLNPMALISSDFGLPDWTFALGTYAPSGIATQQFPEDGPQRYMLTRREVQILYYDFSVAWKYKDMVGVGLSLQWVDVPLLRFDLAVDGSLSPGLVYPAENPYELRAHIEGADHIGFSGILGAWYRPVPCFEVALSGRFIPVKVRADATLAVEPVTLDLDEPIELSRDGSSANDVRFTMTLPAYARLGLRYIFTHKDIEWFDLEADLTYEASSMVRSYNLDGDGLVAEVLGQQIAIDNISIPKHWQDTFSVRLGSDVTVVPEWLSLRVGGFYESPAARPEYSYIDFFSGHRFGVGAGFSFTAGGFDLSASYTYLFQMPVVVNEADARVYQQIPGSPCQAPYTDTAVCDSHYPGQPGPAVNAGTYISDYHFTSVSVRYAF